MINNKKIRSITITSLLFALAIALSFVESSIAAFLMFPPGVKLGLSNVVIMYCFLFVNSKYAFLIVVLKAMFAFLTRGAIAASLSLCGGLLSFITLLTLIILLKLKKEYFIISASSAIMHNIGQLIALSVFFNSLFTLYYIPVLLISGLIMGFITSLTLRAIIPALEKTHIKK